MLTQKNIFNINNYKYLIFDCDGVCLDSNKIKSNLFYDIALSVDRTKAKDFLIYHQNNGGISRYEKFRYFVTDILKIENLNLVKELILKYSERYKNLIDQLSFNTEILKFRKYNKSKWAIISGGDQIEIRHYFKKKSLSYLFELGIYGSPKNKYQLFSNLISKGIDTDKCIYIGDSIYDYNVAKKFRIEFIFYSKWTEFIDWKVFCQKSKIYSFNNFETFLDLK